MFKKVFVPGGNGFLGQSIIKKLKEKNINYVSLSKRDGIDFCDFERTKALFKKEKFDIVINCAALIGGIQFIQKHSGEIYYKNTIIATNLMEAARLGGVKIFINPISSCTYPGHLTEFKENEWWDGIIHESVMAFGFARKMSWVQSWTYHKEYNFKTTNLILSNMYGPGDYFDLVRSHALGALIYKFVEAKEKNLPKVIVWGDGTPIREWLYVEDAADICVKALNMEPILGPVNIGIGKGISILDLAKLIKDAVGYEGEIELDPSKPNGAACKIMNVEKMEQIFKWSPHTDLKTGIKNTVKWYTLARK